jgi:hypothetical protein
MVFSANDVRPVAGLNSGICFRLLNLELDLSVFELYADAANLEGFVSRVSQSTEIPFVKLYCVESYPSS